MNHKHLFHIHNKQHLLCISGNFHAIRSWQSKDMMKLECGPMPNVMVALPNIGGALCSTPQTLADAHY